MNQLSPGLNEAKSGEDREDRTAVPGFAALNPGYGPGIDLFAPADTLAA
jgi:hypothetical protein